MNTPNDIKTTTTKKTLTALAKLTLAAGGPEMARIFALVTTLGDQISVTDDTYHQLLAVLNAAYLGGEEETSGDETAKDTMAKLQSIVAALAAIKAKVKAAGKFGEMFEGARDTLFDGFAALGRYAELVPLGRKLIVCKSKGATLHTWGPDLVHTSPNGKETIVTDDHEMGGDLGSIVVKGHEWTWQEMADGLIRVVGKEAEVLGAEDLNDVWRENATKLTGQKQIDIDMAKSYTVMVESTPLEATVASYKVTAEHVKQLLPKIAAFNAGPGAKVGIWAEHHTDDADCTSSESLESQRKLSMLLDRVCNWVEDNSL